MAMVRFDVFLNGKHKERMSIPIEKRLTPERAKAAFDKTGLQPNSIRQRR